MFSLLTEETVDLGLPTEDLDTLLELGDTVATSRPDVIVYVEGPALQKWSET
jgi:hypothetical protein